MTWNVALQLGRVSNLPTVWTNVLAASAVARAELALAPTLALLLSMSLLYVAGMYLNDAFDRELDARERPERPIPSGTVSARSVFIAGFALLAAGLALLWCTAWTLGAGWPPGAAAALLALAIVAYDMHHKQVGWSPILMGACRSLVYLTSGMLWLAAPTPLLVATAALLLAYVAGLTYAARQENLARIENAWPLLLLAAPAVFALFLIEAAGPVALACLAGFLGWTAWALWHLMRAAPDLRGGVSLLIAGISLVDALFAALSGAPIVAFLCAAGAPLTRLAQRRVAGT